MSSTTRPDPAGGSGSQPPRARRNFGVTVAACVVFVAAMVGASYASVPLYRIFCQVTGYGGTTRQAKAPPSTVSDRVVTVLFDTNVSNGLGWSFRPAQRSMQVKLGEVAHATFIAQNRTDATVTGTASYNVQPDEVGQYFNKLNCFCFTQQTLQAGETEDLGVTFFVDPSYAQDGDLDTTSTITLSYTFYPAPTPSGAKPVAAATAAPADKG
jgi:cytochrome c oxidase assembly protein subunit 11